MNFLLFDGQANVDFGSEFEIKFLENIWKQLQSLIGSKLDQSGITLVIFYFMSLDKPEFTQFANEISVKCTLADCFSMMGQLIYGKNHNPNEECVKIMNFLRENCKRNNWDLAKWLEIQMMVLKF